METEPHNPETKQEAVVAYLAGEGTLQEVADRFGMSRSLLHRIVNRQALGKEHEKLRSEIGAIISLVEILRHHNAPARKRIIEYAQNHIEYKE